MAFSAKDIYRSPYAEMYKRQMQYISPYGNKPIGLREPRGNQYGPTYGGGAQVNPFGTAMVVPGVGVVPINMLPEPEGGDGGGGGGWGDGGGGGFSGTPYDLVNWRI